jgi:O-antigen ligase
LRSRVLDDNHIVLLTAYSIFLPYFITIAIAAFFSVYVLINRRTRAMIFSYRESALIIPFGLIALIAPVCYGNWLGLVCGAGMILILLFGLFIRRVMTKGLFERTLSDICRLSVVTCAVALIEKILNSAILGRAGYQCSSVFFNPNYFGTVTSMVIVICAYKVITRQGTKRIYYSIAAINGISVFLCGSLFVWVEMFVGVAVLLVLAKRHKMLLGFLGLAIFGCVLIFFFPHIIPRIGQANDTFGLRLRVWEVAFAGIKDSPLFGKGALTYFHIYDSYKEIYNVWPTQHAHSIYLDSVLNFGFVGTAFLVLFFFSYYRALVRDHRRHLNLTVSSLIFAVTAGVLMHGTTDVTIFWVQTGMLFVIILGGIGALEKRADRLDAKSEPSLTPGKNGTA